MNCRRLEPELIAFHFGTVSLATREEVERHLVGCAECVKAFCALKRAVETSDGEPPASPATRQRIRRAVQDELAGQVRWVPWTWWQKSLAVGIASAAVLVSVFATHALSLEPGSPPRMLTRSAPAQLP